MYLGDQFGWGSASGLGGARAFGRARAYPVAVTPPARRDWRVDLASDLGSARWWRGIAKCLLPLAAAWMLAPPVQPLAGAVPSPTADDEPVGTIAIAPLARGGSGGRRRAPTSLAVPLARAPERARINSVVTLGAGDTFAALLARVGVAPEDARMAAALVSQTSVALPPGLPIEVTLGARPDLSHPRPLDRLELRPRVDLALSVRRNDGRLTLLRQPIAMDRAPMRIGGLAGAGLYEAMRAAGVPGEAAAEYLKAIAPRVPFGEVTATDAFDLVIERERAATGEVRYGRLLFAGFGAGAHQLRLVRWTMGGSEGWYDADGQMQRQGSLGMPVAGHITSGFGMRFHPILGFSRMHAGLDIGAPVGTPVFAVIDGAVASAGWRGGYGNFIMLAHGGGMTSGYGHLSRLAVHAGEPVRRGQIIGYVGSTGMSTGPHLHWEIRRGGVPIDPLRVAQAGITTLDGAAMSGFHARVAWLTSLPRGG